MSINAHYPVTGGFYGLIPAVLYFESEIVIYCRTIIYKWNSLQLQYIGIYINTFENILFEIYFIVFGSQNAWILVFH